MKLPILQDAPECLAKPLMVRETEAESFAVPIRYGAIRRERSVYPGLYHILLRQKRGARTKRAWARERTLSEV